MNFRGEFPNLDKSTKLSVFTYCQHFFRFGCGNLLSYYNRGRISLSPHPSPRGIKHLTPAQRERSTTSPGDTRARREKCGQARRGNHCNTIQYSIHCHTVHSLTAHCTYHTTSRINSCIVHSPRSLGTPVLMRLITVDSTFPLPGNVLALNFRPSTLVPFRLWSLSI